MYKHVLN